MDLITNPAAWVAFGTLLALEIVLGVDNVIFISILADKLPVSQQAKGATSVSPWRWSRGYCCCYPFPG